MLYLFIDLVRFIRVETALFITGMAASGYIIFSGINYGIINLLLAVFFLCGAGYGCNQLTDKEEDVINNGRLNFFAMGLPGLFIVVSFTMVGIAFSLLMHPLSMLIYLMSIPVVMSYSVLRVKKIPLMKNLYTGFTMALAFIIGAFNGNPTPDALYYFLFVMFMGFVANIIGDIRGYEGDMRAGVKTIPVIFGIIRTEMAVRSMVLFVLLLTASSAYLNLLFFAPFLVMMIIFLGENMHKAARFSILSSFSLFPMFLLFLNFG